MTKKISFLNLGLVFLGGIIVTLACLSMYIYFSYGSGLYVRVDMEQFLPQINQIVVDVTKEQLPNHIDKAKDDIPIIIDEHMSGQISEAFVTVGDIKVDLPEEMIDSMEQNFKDNVEYAMLQLLLNIDEDELAKSISSDIEATAELMLTQHFKEHKIHLKPNSFFTIPVTLMFEEDEDLVPAMNLDFD
ncbi:hypothetical protein PRVXT_001429 [Proteinivorax tanatarense]|uniref:Uncharacterized protein n=1 Tax=Proteinivorax tanatarense TaxID=1260629 RepID=A0AAU7VR07_9FIRM